MSLYSGCKAHSLAVALTLSDIKSQIENTEDSLEKALAQTRKDLKRVELLEGQLVTMFQFIRDSFENGALKEDETDEIKTTKV